MPLVTTTEMFKKAYDGGYAIGAFNVNNMEIIQGIVEAATEEKAPLILQVSAGARKYANTVYLKKMVEAAVETSGLPICLHLDHGDSFALCKDCVDSGFTSVMIDASAHSFAENISITRQVVEYAHDHGVVVEAELGKLAGIEDAVKVDAKDARSALPTAHSNSRVSPNSVSTSSKKSADVCPASPSFSTVLPASRRNTSKSSISTAAICPAHKACPKKCSAKPQVWRSAKSTSTATCVLRSPQPSENTSHSTPLTSTPVSIWGPPETRSVRLSSTKSSTFWAATAKRNNAFSKTKSKSDAFASDFCFA